MGAPGDGGRMGSPTMGGFAPIGSVGSLPFNMADIEYQLPIAQYMLPESEGGSVSRGQVPQSTNLRADQPNARPPPMDAMPGSYMAQALQLAGLQNAQPVGGFPAPGGTPRGVSSDVPQGAGLLGGGGANLEQIIAAYRSGLLG